jgi:hypothetical protein
MLKKLFFRKLNSCKCRQLFISCFLNWVCILVVGKKLKDIAININSNKTKSVKLSSNNIKTAFNYLKPGILLNLN